MTQFYFPTTWLSKYVSHYGIVAKFHLHHYANLSELINFYAPWNLMILGELIRLNSIEITSEIWQRSLQKV